jgi:hypothetical protein
MGKPVEVFSWPMRRGPVLRLKEVLWRRYGINAGGPLTVTIDRLVDWGFLKPPRDFAALHRELRARGLIAALGESEAVERRPLDDMERAVAAIRALFQRP